MTATRTGARENLEALGRQVRGRGERARRGGPGLGRAGKDGPGRGGFGSPRRRATIIAVVAVFVCALGWVVAFSPLLAVSRVEVTGLHRLSAGQVLAQAKIADGTPLVRVPRGAIARRVDQLPDVLTASVSISFPSTVVVHVTERTASGVLRLAADSWALVDETGHRFNTVQVKPAGLPVLMPAAAVVGDPAVLAAMAQIAVSVPASVRPLLVRVTAGSVEDVTLVLSDGRTVVWGASDRNAQKARVLPALLARPGLLYNISDPDLPYTRTD